MHYRSFIFSYLVIACLAISVPLLQAKSDDIKKTDPTLEPAPTETLSTTLDSISIMLKPQLQSSPLPAWINRPLNFSPESSSLEISLAPISQQTTIDHFVLTVVFDDHGDGGPLIEWKKPSGERTMICSGLGINGPAVGFNSRKLLIPYDLAFDGGTLLIQHAGRFDQVISATVQVAHTATVASLTAEHDATLLDEVGNVTAKDILAGDVPLPKEGDITKGRLMSAELSSAIQQGNQFEFPFQLEGETPDTAMLNTEIIGLDLESQVEVRVNDIFIGVLNTASFSLTAAELINTPGEISNFHFAGWRKAWLYIPKRVWKQGEENRILLSLPESSTAPLISLKNSRLDLYYSNLSLGNSTTPLAKNFFRY